MMIQEQEILSRQIEFSKENVANSISIFVERVGEYQRRAALIAREVERRKTNKYNSELLEDMQDIASRLEKDNNVLSEFEYDNYYDSNIRMMTTIPAVIAETALYNIKALLIWMEEMKEPYQ